MWVDIKATEMEVDGVAEALAIAVAAGPVLHPLDAGVDPFSPGVGHSLDHGSEDSFQVLPNPGLASLPPLSLPRPH